MLPTKSSFINISYHILSTTLFLHPFCLAYTVASCISVRARVHEHTHTQTFHSIQVFKCVSFPNLPFNSNIECWTKWIYCMTWSIRSLLTVLFFPLSNHLGGMRNSLCLAIRFIEIANFIRWEISDVQVVAGWKGTRFFLLKASFCKFLVSLWGNKWFSISRSPSATGRWKIMKNGVLIHDNNKLHLSGFPLEYNQRQHVLLVQQSGKLSHNLFVSPSISNRHRTVAWCRKGQIRPRLIQHSRFAARQAVSCSTGESTPNWGCSNHLGVGCGDQWCG